MMAAGSALPPPAPGYVVVSRGAAAGTYQAFPDACRLKNGTILCVFYAGYTHVSLPSAEWPKGGRICMVRSRDEGRTWTPPEVLFDDAMDNRDPHIAQLRDGTVICTFFSLKAAPGGGYDSAGGVQAVRSRDGGKTWEERGEVIVPGYGCSAPVRQLPDGACVLGLYYEKDGRAYGAVARSTDGARTWGPAIRIPSDEKVYLDAETDLVRNSDGVLYAALRGGGGAPMHFSTSADGGLTWSPARSIGFAGHCPHFTRLRSGVVVLSQRIPDTAVYLSRDGCRTWDGPYRVDTVGGAYPATVELRDGTVLVVYYTEGQGSEVRARRFGIAGGGIELLPL